jgi:hypothetical protein
MWDKAKYEDFVANQNVGDEGVVFKLLKGPKRAISMTSNKLKKQKQQEIGA